MICNLTGGFWHAAHCLFIFTLKPTLTANAKEVASAVSTHNVLVKNRATVRYF